MKKKHAVFTSLAVAGGVILSFGGASAATAADVQSSERISIEGAQPRLGGYCTLGQGTGHASWSIPAVYPPGTKVVAESTDSGREWSSEFPISAGEARLPTYKGPQATTYRVKFVSPAGTESKESTITYSRPYIGQCGTTHVLNGVDVQNIDYPEGAAIRSVSSDGPGVTKMVMDTSAFQGAYRYFIRIDNKYAGEVHAGTSYYNHARDNGDGTTAVEIKTEPGLRTVEILIDSSNPGQELSAEAQVLLSKVVG